MKERELFFSIIVPARDEEKYISRTLRSLNSLDYPKSKYEIVIVESGSSDNTFKTAKKFKSSLVKVYHINRKGVSVARNFGASKSSKKAEWLIFSDADNVLGKNFLNIVSKRISEKKRDVIGTMRVKSLEKSFKMNIVYYLYNLFLMISGASYALQIVKKEFFNKVKYDENLRVGEDYVIIKALRKYGDFFFIWTDQAETSTRRFKKWGVFKLFIMWVKGSLGQYDYKKKLNYEVVR